MTTPSKNECRRCGACCEKGGPAFHLEDRELIVDGIIHTRYLFTIRKGEYVYDNVAGQLKPAQTDIVKIKGKPGKWACVFFRKKGNACGIYSHRPLECRLLKCWDSKDMEGAYEKGRLTRQDLIAEIEGLWEIIEAHEQRCPYVVINRAVQDLEGAADQRERANELLLGAIQYDNAIRQLVMEKGHVAPDMVDFLFGRPLTVTLKASGCTVQRVNGEYRVQRKGPTK